MATNLFFNDQLPHGRLLRSGLLGLENGKASMNAVLGSMATMITGDGSSSAHFPEVTTRFGFTSDANSKAAWDELQSLMAKLNTDGSVTAVDAAMKQAANKMR